MHGNTTSYTYDGLYRLVNTTLPVASGPGAATDAVIHTDYDLVGNVILQTDANGNATTYQYDNDYRVTLTTDPMGNTSTYTYDMNGNVLSETDSQTGLVTTYGAYDGINRPTSMTQLVRQGAPGSPTATYLTSYTYTDSTGTMMTTDPNHNENVVITDGLGRVYSEITDAGGLDLTTTYTYDGDGNQISMTDPDGNVTKYVYDGLDRQIEIEYPVTPDDTSGHVTEEFFYDGDNNVVKTVDKRGIVSTTGYDNLNRVTSQQMAETLSDNAETVALSTFAYTDTGPNHTYSVATRTATGTSRRRCTTRLDAPSLSPQVASPRSTPMME